MPTSVDKFRVKKTDFLTLKDSDGDLLSVIAPNGLQIGLDDDPFQSDLVIKNTISIKDLGSDPALTADKLYNIDGVLHFNGSALSSTNTFSTFAVSGQSDVVADSSTDTLTLVAGTNVTITTNASTDAITIAAGGAVGDITSVVAGGGLEGGGTSGDVTLSIRSNVVPNLTGTNTFSGANTFSTANTFSGNNTLSGDNTFSGKNTFTEMSASHGVHARSQTPVYFWDSDNSQYAKIMAPTDLSANYTLTLPADDGSADQVLKTDGSGNLSWTNAGTGTGDITAVTAGAGLEGGGTSGAVTLAIRNSIVPNLTGTNTFSGANTFSGVSTFSENVTISSPSLFISSSVSGFTATGSIKVLSPAGISGSITRLSDGKSYIMGGDGVTVTSASNGQITVAAASKIQTVTAGSGLSGGGSTPTVTLSINSSIVPDLTGSNIFRGKNNFENGMSGSLTKLTNGTSYLVASDGIVITSGSNTQVVISATGNITSVTAGSGLEGGGSSGAISLGVRSNIFPYLTGTNTLTGKNTFSENVTISGPSLFLSSSVSGFTATGSIKVPSPAGISGSITRLSDGKSYLAAGANITITSASSGQVTIAGNAGDITSVTAGTGLQGGGASGAVTLSIRSNVVPNLTGTNIFTGNNSFSGPVFLSGSISGFTATGSIKVPSPAGISGSITRLSDGKSYLAAGANITITSASSGQITIAGTAGDITAVTAGAGLEGGGSSGDVTLKISSLIVPNLTGTNTFTGNNKFSGPVFLSGSISGFTATGSIKVPSPAGISGSITRLSDGKSYLAAGSNITIVSASNGQITISSTGGGSGSPGGSNTQVQFNDDSSFAGDSAFTFNKTTNTLSVSNLSGSLTKIADGKSYLIAGSSISISSASNGQITISSTGGGGFGTGVGWSGPAAGIISSTGSIGIGTSTPEHTLSVTGTIGSSLGISGSLTRLTNGTSYISSGKGASVLSSSNGQIIIGLSSTRRDKVNYEITSSHSSGAPVFISGADFSTGQYSNNFIDVFVNGVLLYSGSSNDYVLSANATNKVTFNFSLNKEDVVTTIVAIK